MAVTGTASSLRRALRLLDLVAVEEAAHSGGLGVTDVARLAGVDKSQASRTLKTLADEGLIERDPDTLEYRLGPKLFAYATIVARRRLLQAAPPVLRDIVKATGERGHLSVLEGPYVVTLLSESPPHAVQTAGWVGRAVPAWSTASGRALLIDHDLPQLEALLADVPLSSGRPGAPATLAELAERIASSRSQGYTTVVEEFEAELVAVGAPVRDFAGRIVAAVNASGPKFRFGTDLDEAGRSVAAAARELSVSLGAPAPSSTP